MASCSGCGAHPSGPDASKWICEFCGRTNRVAPEPAPDLVVAEASEPEPRGPTDVRAALIPFAHLDDFFVGDAIPSDKLNKAMASCSCPADEEIVALADLTVFGSAKNCVLFTDRGIYYRNDRSGKQPGTFFKAYADMKVGDEDGGSTEVSVGAGGYIDTSGSALSKGKMTEILEAVSC